MNLRAYHLPGTDLQDVCVLERDGICALAPRLSPDELRDICTRLIAARTALARLPVDRIIAAIDAAARQLQHTTTSLDGPLVRGIAAFTGYSPAMTAHVLTRMCDDWLAPNLEQLLVFELGGPEAVDGFISRNGVLARAVAAPLGFHVFSGNVPGVSVTSLVRALLVKSAVLGKCAAGEPLLAPHFAQLLNEIDPDVGACLGITYWSGGDEALESVALAHADTVVHYGSQSAITALRRRAPAHVNFVEHGPRISFAVVGGAAIPRDVDRIADDLALAVALFEQQGCVSPQTVYVIGDAAATRTLAERAAASFDALHQKFPRGRIDAAEAAAIRDLRTQAEFRAIRGEPVELWCGDNLAWTLILEPGPEFTGSCLNRTLVVRQVADFDDLIAAVQPFGALLQTVGIDGFTPEEALTLARQLTDIGATRITPIAAMPWPPVTWHHDGRGPLTELIRWADLADLAPFSTSG